MIKVQELYFYPHPIGACIYCGSTEEPITDEHVLAFAIGGNLILPKASCERCRKHTQKIKQICATHMFGAYRVKIGGPTQNPNKWSDTIRVIAIDEDGNRVPVFLPKDKHPGALPLPKFPPPGALTGQVSDDTQYWLNVTDPASLKALMMEHEDKSLEIAQVRGGAFMQMLAKVAHAATVAEIGQPPGMIYTLPDIVLGTAPEPRKYVGGYLEDFPPDSTHHWSTLHSVERAGELQFVCRIRLYAYMGAPISTIVSGICSNLQNETDKTIPHEDFLDAK